MDEKFLIAYSVALFFGSFKDFVYNLRFKLSFIVVFFRMVHKKKAYNF